MSNGKPLYIKQKIFDFHELKRGGFVDHSIKAYMG